MLADRCPQFTRRTPLCRAPSSTPERLRRPRPGSRPFFRPIRAPASSCSSARRSKGPQRLSPFAAPRPYRTRSRRLEAPQRAPRGSIQERMAGDRVDLGRPAGRRTCRLLCRLGCHLAMPVSFSLPWGPSRAAGLRKFASEGFSGFQETSVTGADCRVIRSLSPCSSSQ